ncbi:sugar phosphate isomerase/epimerase family protein [Haloglycomyces albus]|uniref:sugar phosphate isomerase/epimerase family protein n=1 Tax=Haloglycomyces albus TaxID=526067 RepID=UPI0004BC4DA5|nr:sugar phosphate isomerase/epimerase [Haloglycomyces albus]
MSDSADVLLSTTAVYPEPTAVGFELATELGYDGVELMVFTDRVSQDPSAAARLSKHYGAPIKAVHAPCLLVTQGVWSRDPWKRLRKTVAVAQDLGAGTVVIHPPFAWQRNYARNFSTVLQGLKARYPAITIAVENMFPVKVGPGQLGAFKPHWDPTVEGYDAYTLDLSHCAASGADAMEMAQRMGDRLRHLHLCDGVGPGVDEHRVPGRGEQPCADILEQLADKRWDGQVTVEVSTRKAKWREERLEDLYESLKFAKKYLRH